MYLNKLIAAAIVLICCGCQKLDFLGLGPGDDQILASAADADDCGFVVNSYGQRVSWQKNLPVSIHVHPEYPTTYIQSLYQAGDKWTQALGTPAFNFIESESEPTAKPTRDSRNVIYYASTWTQNQHYQALTTLYWKKNQILETDMNINGSNFVFGTDLTSSPTKAIHLESLLVHELGHMLGLKHRSQLPTVMYESLGSGAIRTTLSSSDLNALKCEY